MKTFVLVVMMLAVALAAGGSFFVRTEAQEGSSATLDVDCPMSPVPSGVDTVRSCRFVATNTGSSAIIDARLDFVPSGSQPIPDRYFFFSYSLDGEQSNLSGGQTSYGFRDLAPSETRTIAIEVIVRTTHDFAADAVLSSPLDGELDRATIASDVTSDASEPVTVRLTPLDRAEYGDSASYELRVAKHGEGELNHITAEIASGPGATVRGAVEYIGGRTSIRLSDLGEGQAVKVLLTFEAETCTFVYPAVIVRAARVRPDGVVEPIAAAALADDSADSGDCTGSGRALPAGGAGPTDAAARFMRSVLLAVIVLGATMVAFGIAAQRR